MPRRPRIHLDGLPLHIVQRGHNREACFFCEEDYQSYLHWLGEALTRERVQLHAYALMTNHVHLLVTPATGASVPRLIMSLGRRYVQYINRTYRRTGTLWDSRYKSSLIDADSYLLSCMRYIVQGIRGLQGIRGQVRIKIGVHKNKGVRHHKTVFSPFPTCQ
jgi:putative transposase